MNVLLPTALAGQCYIPHPGGQELDECRGPHSQGLLRGFHQVPEGVRHSGGQFPGGILAHEGPGEETPGEERETGGVSDTCQARLAEKTHLPCPSPQRIQGHGLLLTAPQIPKTTHPPSLLIYFLLVMAYFLGAVLFHAATCVYVPSKCL